MEEEDAAPATSEKTFWQLTTLKYFSLVIVNVTGCGAFPHWPLDSAAGDSLELLGDFFSRRVRCMRFYGVMVALTTAFAQEYDFMMILKIIKIE